MIKFRRSKEEDKEQILEVFNSYFPGKANDGVTVNLENRYVVAFDTGVNKIVGFAGIIKSEDSAYKGCEIDWSCTTPNYIHTSLLMNLLVEVMKGIHEDIYCESWRVEDKAETDLICNLKKLGFEIIVEGRILNSSTYSKACDSCPMRNENEECNCCYDLYIRRKK